MDPENYTFSSTQLPNPNGNGGKKRSGTGLLAFVCGFLLAALIGLIVIVSLVSSGQASSGGEGMVNARTEHKLRQIREKLELLYLFDMSEADTEAGIIKGYVDSLGDPYTEYYTPEEYKEIELSTSGTYSGIGVVVQQDADTGIITVVKPYRNSPGAEAGIQVNDILYKVEGEPVTGEDLNLVVTRIRGEEGTFVNITVYRPSTNEYIDLTVERRQIKVETVAGEMLEDGVGMIQIDSFEEVTFDQFVKAYEELESQGMKALIVDLRDNGGGLLDSVANILDYLLPEGIITYTEDKYGNRDNYRSNASAVLDIPCAILTNGNTASASEIFTGCMKDYGKAVSVGSTTFGKGIVQTLMPLGDGSALKVTTAYYYTPSGVCIHGEGIEPDYPVDYDYTSDEDAQLLKAVELMREEIQAAD